MSKPYAYTDRLKIYRVSIEQEGERNLFVAMLDDDFTLTPIATAVATAGLGLTLHVWWLEVSAEYRRKGFGTEFARWLEEEGWFLTDGITESGEHFQLAYEGNANGTTVAHTEE